MTELTALFDLRLIRTLNLMHKWRKSSTEYRCKRESRGLHAKSILPLSTTESKVKVIVVDCTSIDDTGGVQQRRGDRATCLRCLMPASVPYRPVLKGSITLYRRRWLGVVEDTNRERPTDIRSAGQLCGRRIGHELSRHRYEQWSSVMEDRKTERINKERPSLSFEFVDLSMSANLLIMRPFFCQKLAKQFSSFRWTFLRFRRSWPIERIESLMIYHSFIFHRQDFRQVARFISWVFVILP